MSYKINLEAYSSIYALPSSVVDKHIKLSGAIQLKVLLYFMRNLVIAVLPYLTPRSAYFR